MDTGGSGSGKFVVFFNLYLYQLRWVLLLFDWKRYPWTGHYVSFLSLIYVKGIGYKISLCVCVFWNVCFGIGGSTSSPRAESNSRIL